MNQPVLQAERLTKRYRRRVVVDHLSLTVEAGDIFGFLGQNGAGKSTTIRMALGLVRPTSGKVRVLGYDMARRPLAALKRVGAIIEAPAFYENFSGWQNLRMFAAMSGGVERQRLGIAQALLPNPELVILDEPTDGLDPQGLSETRALIRRLRDELGLTVMLSSHLLHEVEQICNRVAIIEEGRLLYQGPVEDLIAKDNWIKLRVDRVTEAYD